MSIGNPIADDCPPSTTRILEPRQPSLSRGNGYGIHVLCTKLRSPLACHYPNLKEGIVEALYSNTNNYFPLKFCHMSAHIRHNQVVSHVNGTSKDEWGALYGVQGLNTIGVGCGLLSFVGSSSNNIKHGQWQSNWISHVT